MRAKGTTEARSAERFVTGRRLLVLLLVAAALKLAFLAAPRTDLLGNHPRTGEALEFHPEEISRASIALEVREGPLLPVRDYQWTHTFGGSLVVGLAAIPFFEVFGVSVFSLKLAPLCFELLVVALGFLLYDRLFGPRAAWIGGLLLAVSSPGQALLATIAWGTHASTNAFVMGGFLCYVLSLERSADGAVARVRPGWRFAFGLLSGFALWFGSSYLVALLAVLICELVRDRREFLRVSSGALLAGLLIGLTPWLRYNSFHDYAGLAVDSGIDLLDMALVPRLARVPERFVEFSTTAFPAGLWHRDVGFVPGALLAVVATASAFVMAALGAWRLRGSVACIPRAFFALGPQRCDPALVLLLHPALFLLGLMLSDHWSSLNAQQLTPYFFFSPLFPGLFGLAAAGVDGWWDRASRPALRWAGGVVVALFLATGVVGQLGLVRIERIGALHDLDPDQRRSHGRWLALRCGDDPPRMASLGRGVVERRDGVTRDDLLDGMASGLEVLIRVQEARGGPYDLEGLRESQRRLAAELPANFAERFRGESTR